MGGMALTGKKAVVYKGKGTVAVEDIGYPELILRDGPGVPKANVNRKCEHGVILKVITTNICGSDQHMVRGRTTAPEGLVLGHEITGEVIETGRDVEFIKKGDIVSVPFNIACGRCVMCKTQKTHVCLNVNPGTGRDRLTATSIWAAGSAASLNTSWCHTLIFSFWYSLIKNRR